MSTVSPSMRWGARRRQTRSPLHGMGELSLKIVMAFECLACQKRETVFCPHWGREPLEGCRKHMASDLPLLEAVARRDRK